MRGADYIVQHLSDAGITQVFGYPGGAIMPVYDALVDSPLSHRLFRHEQGAALAADGFARASGKVGVCIGTSGPGATNLITGIANAYLDSVPMLVITGQVATELMGTDAFQEVDVIGLTLPIVKHSYIVQDVEQLPAIMTEALALTTEGRPGPVLIDVPKDVQTAVMATEVVCQAFTSVQEVVADYSFEMNAFKQLIQAARKPLVYHGGGIQCGDAIEEFREFISRSDIPAVHTLKGIGNLASEAEQNLGMLGMHGHKAANLAVQEADLLIVLGARFDDRATGKLDTFAPNAKVIHVETDPAEVNKLRESDLPLVGNLKTLLPVMTAHCHEFDCGNWKNQCQQNKKDFAWDYAYPNPDIYAPKLLRHLSENYPSDSVVSCDVGQHQMWVAQHCLFDHPRAHLSSGGLGTMGYGLPAAIGAQFSRPDTTVIAVCGDGSFMMNLQELATIRRYGLPVKIIIIDNESLGMVRQWQQLFFSERFSEINLSDNPSFTEVAQCFGIPGEYIDKDRQIEPAIDRLLAAEGAYLLHVKICSKSNVWPLVPPGASNNQMMEGQPL